MIRARTLGPCPLPPPASEKGPAAASGSAASSIQANPCPSKQLQEEQGKPALAEGHREGLQEDWSDARLKGGLSGQTAECADTETRVDFVESSQVR